MDNIRFCASFLVILGHSHPEYVADAATHSLTTAGLWASLFGLMASPSSELFMTISGAILLPVRIPDKEFFRKRFSKVLFPLLIWSLVYLCAGLGPQNRTAVEALLKLPFTPVLDVFWFMYVICGLYLFAPIISKWILYEDRNSMRFYLGIWAFVSFLPLLNLISPGLYDSQGSYYFVLNNFGGFLGYMILGTYLKRYQTSVSKSKFLKCCASVVLFSALLFLLRACFHVLPPGFIYDNLCFISIVYVYTIFTIIQYASRFITRIQGVFTELSKHSFGIYLSHILIIHFVTQPFVSFLQLPPYAAIPLMAVMTYLCCYITIKLLTFLPKSKYIVGI
ncbi:acyltransferase [Bacteroides sp.]